MGKVMDSVYSVGREYLEKTNFSKAASDMDWLVVSVKELDQFTKKALGKEEFEKSSFAYMLKTADPAKVLSFKELCDIADVYSRKKEGNIVNVIEQVIDSNADGFSASSLNIETQELRNGRIVTYQKSIETQQDFDKFAKSLQHKGIMYTKKVLAYAADIVRLRAGKYIELPKAAKEAPSISLDAASELLLNKEEDKRALVAKKYAEVSAERALLEAKYKVSSVNDDLWRAVRDGDLQEVKDLLNAGADLNVKEDNWGRTVLMWAVDHTVDEGYADVVELLLDKGADLNIKDNSGNTALMWAARNDRTDTAKLLLDRGADINVQDRDGNTALIWAKKDGYSEIVKLLKRYGATASKKMEMGRRHRTAIDINEDLLDAAEWGNAQKVKELLDQGADPNTKDKDGETALHWAARYDRRDIVKLLLDAGVDINIKDNNGWTALDWAKGRIDIVELLKQHGATASRHRTADINDELQNAAVNGDLEKVKELLDRGADPNAKNTYGNTALIIAEDYEYADMIDLFKQHGATASKKIEKRHRIAGINDDLIKAVQDEDLKKVKELLDQGADVNVRDRNGWTVLELAAAEGCTDIVKLLLEKGADPNAKDEDGYTALDWAVEYEYPEIADLLEQHGATVSRKMEMGRRHRTADMKDWLEKPERDMKDRLQEAISDGDLDTVENLLDQEADPNEKDEFGNAALHWGAISNNIDIVKLLLDRGANIDAENNEGYTALMTAEKWHSTEVADLLKQHGAIASRRMERGRRASINEDFIDAVKAGDLQEVKRLLDKGADPNAEDEYDRTALMVAVRKGYTDIAKLLLDVGADPNAKDGEGKTVLDWAADMGFTDVIELLKEHGATAIASRRRVVDINQEHSPQEKRIEMGKNTGKRVSKFIEAVPVSRIVSYDLANGPIDFLVDVVSWQNAIGQVQKGVGEIEVTGITADGKEQLAMRVEWNPKNTAWEVVELLSI